MIFFAESLHNGGFICICITLRYFFTAHCTLKRSLNLLFTVLHIRHIAESVVRNAAARSIKEIYSCKQSGNNILIAFNFNACAFAELFDIFREAGKLNSERFIRPEPGSTLQSKSFSFAKSA